MAVMEGFGRVLSTLGVRGGCDGSRVVRTCLGAVCLSRNYCNIGATSRGCFNGSISSLGTTRYTTVTSVARCPDGCSPLQRPRGGEGHRLHILSGVLRGKTLARRRCGRTIGCRVIFAGDRGCRNDRISSSRDSTGRGEVSSCCISCIVGSIVSSLRGVNCARGGTGSVLCNNNLGVCATISCSIRGTLRSICRGCGGVPSGGIRNTVIIVSCRNEVLNLINNANGCSKGLKLGETSRSIHRPNSIVGPLSICKPTFRGDLRSGGIGVC